MTADDHTHRERLNPTGAHDTGVQTVVTVLRTCGGMCEFIRQKGSRRHIVLIRYTDSSGAEVRPIFRKSCVDFQEGDAPDPNLIADGSGLIGDHDLSITSNDIFELLASPRRRALIKQISVLTPTGEENDTHLELRELATMTAVSQTGVHAGELSDDARHRAYVSLTQVHADSLEEHGVAEYHNRVKKITPTADIHALAAIIEAIEAAAEDEV